MTSTEISGGAEIAHLREETVQGGLVGHRPTERGRAVVLADQRHPVEPGRPVLGEVALDPELGRWLLPQVVGSSHCGR